MAGDAVDGAGRDSTRVIAAQDDGAATDSRGRVTRHLRGVLVHYELR